MPDYETHIAPDGSEEVLIHYVYEAPGLVLANTVREVVACLPGKTVLHSTYRSPMVRRTNEPRAVTCANCKQTDVFKARMREIQEMLDVRV
jgi:hypothetical protein